MLSWELAFGAMDYRRRFKRLYTVFTLCWIGVCSIGGVAISPAGGVRAHSPTLAARDLIKDLAGPEYEVIRQSSFFQNVAAVFMQAGHRISSATDDLIADTEVQDQPEEFGFISRLMATKVEVLAWFAITAIPPILAYILGFVVIPRIAGGIKP
jgi:hypothetical protein